MSIKIPDTLIMLVCIVFVFCGLTWIIPAGEFDRVMEDGRSLVVMGSYQEVAASPATLGDFILAPIKGFIDSAQIIVFIFMVAGSFGIIRSTGSISAGLRSMISSEKTGGRVWIIPLLTVLFSLAGATFGMSEEVLVFVLITLPMAHSMGYDTFIGVGIPFLGAGAGFAGAFINPFTIGIAQGIAELPPFSGWEYRILVWCLFTAVTVVFLMLYARKIHRKPEKSFIPKRMQPKVDPESGFSTRQKLIISLFLLGLVMLVVGVNQWDWYINEISGLFIVLGVITAMVARMKVKEAVDAFVSSAADMLKVCLVIALAKGVIIIASEGKIIDTILHAMTNAVDDYPRTVSVQLMLYMQSLLNFFLPSGSGQAALTMPIMAPLGDLIGISRQTAVLAFQFGDGISNMIIPTSGVTMGVLTIAEIPYHRWVRWVWPLILTFFLLAMVLLIPPLLYFNY